MKIPGVDLNDPDIIDIGQDHVVRIMYTDETETEIASLVLMHPHSDDPDVLCQGFAEIGPGEWEVVTRDPLTVHPSFVCSDCEDHGIIRNGKWHQAFWDTSDHQIPFWLHYAMTAFCNSNEEIKHVYRRPIPIYNYASPMDLVIYGQWKMLVEWLDEMIVQQRTEKVAIHQQ